MKQFNSLQLFYAAVMITLLILTSSCESDMENEINIELAQKSASTTPRILVNGVPLKIEGLKPTTKDNILMVPAFPVFERLGYSTRYNIFTRTYTFTNTSKKVEITLGRTQAKVNGERVQQVTEPYRENNTLMVPFNFFGLMSEIKSEYDQDTKSLQLYNFDELDYGLYFYGKQSESNDLTMDAVGTQKFVKGTPNAFYDPTKPTIIWVHGWQNGGAKNKFKNNFHLNKKGLNKFVHNEWIEQGWNVAIFNWVNLSDELLPYDAESKINSTTTDGVNMRWKNSQGEYITDNTPSKSVAQLFAEAYDDLAATQINTNIRLAGSSFGGQVVLHGAEEIQKNGVSFLPSRIALLDIAWTRNYVVSQDLRTTEISVRAAKALSPNVLIEYYRSSILGNFTPKELVEQTAFQHMVFSYAGNLGIELKHTAITEHYFWSLAHEAPVAYGPNNTTANIALSASLDDETLRLLMNGDNHFYQVEGRDTFDPSDDAFEFRNGAW